MRGHVASLFVVAALLGGCSAPTEETVAASDGASPAPADEAPAPSPSPSPSPLPPPSPSPSPLPTTTDATLAEAGVNEVGRVVVGQWHIIGDTDGEYRTSRATFRAQLQDLYDRGYRPVTQAEFIAGTFPIPLGTAPILLTFDDSTRGQFDLDEDGELVPDTAVAILEEFAAAHPDWRATAVFAFNFPEPFGDDRFVQDLQWLVDHGYELSNHSVGHTNLGKLSAEQVVANLADNQAQLHAAVPGAPVPSLTLPFGAHAKDATVERRGTVGDVTYEHDLVYLVGSYPSRSPHDVDFDPGQVQRVPAHAVVGAGPEWFTDQLDALESSGNRFISDGEPSVVTVPADRADAVRPLDGGLTLRTYDPVG